MIGGISLVTGSALTLNTFGDLFLFCWRYILKWTNHTLSAFKEIYHIKGNESR